MICKLAGVVIGRVLSGETSVDVELFSAEQGRVRVRCKGVRSPRSALAGILDLYHDLEMQVESSRTDLFFLREARLVHARLGLSQEYARLQMAGYFCDLVKRATHQAQPDEALLQTLMRALDWVAQGHVDPRTVSRFQWRLLQHLGLASDSLREEDAGEMIRKEFGD